MAALSVTHPTLLDLAKASDPDGKVAMIAEILMEEHAILDDVVFETGNLITGHTTTIRTGLPEPTWVKFNQGVQPAKGTTRQVTFNTGRMVAFSEVDAALAKLNDNVNAWRLSQDRAYIQGFGNKLARTLFYGNDSVTPEEFTGLAYYYSVLSAESGDNIIDAGGTGTDNNSIWLVGWGDRRIKGIVPKGSTAGLSMENKGLVTRETDPNGAAGLLDVFRTKYSQEAGLAVEDWRYGIRIANIDKSLLTWDAATGPNLPNLMFEALSRVPNLNGRWGFYMSRDMQRFVDTQIPAATKNSTLTTEMVGGRFTSSFKGVPIRRVDALAADEARVV